MAVHNQLQLIQLDESWIDDLGNKMGVGPRPPDLGRLVSGV